MRVANIMLGRGLGGIEQAFLDYAVGLTLAGHEVSCITDPTAAINERIPASSLSHVTLSNMGPWDPFAGGRLAKLLNVLRADIIITHGNRALTFAKKAAGGKIPIIAVTHNYNLQHLIGADAVFTITRDLQQKVIAEFGFPAHRVFHVPNMVRVEKGFIRPVWQKPPVIGSLGRMVEKKGFDIFLEALAQLHQRKISFRAVLGGDGEERKKLKELVIKLGLYDVVTFPGWVQEPLKFLSEMDIFCLPSHHEPFGIVLLEAMAAKLPIVSTDAEGPREILTPNEDGIIVPRADPKAMADALEFLLNDESAARNLASNAYRTVRDYYEIDKVGAWISSALSAIHQDVTGVVQAS